MSSKYNNNLAKNYAAVAFDSDDDCGAASRLASNQNDCNAMRLNNGTVGDVVCETNSGKPGFTCSRRNGIIIISITTFILIAGVIAICSSFVLIGMMSFQQIQMASLRRENEALKTQNSVYKNETLSHAVKTTTCVKELTDLKHLMQINSMQCQLTKENISSILNAEIKESESEKESAVRELQSCQNQKEELSRSCEAQKVNGEAERKDVADRLKRCEEEKSDLSDRVLANVREASDALKNLKCPLPQSASRTEPSHNGSIGGPQASTTLTFAIFLSVVLRQLL